MIVSMKDQIKAALPKHVTPERMSRIAMTALRTNPKLAQSTPESFLGSLMNAAQLGLEPNTPLGQCYLIPYFNGKLKSMECQFQIGYKGMLDLAYRTGDFKVIYAKEVYKEDEFEYSFGLNMDLIHKPSANRTGKPIFYYACYKLSNGGYNFEVMSRKDAETWGKKHSKTFAFGPWKNHFDEMAKKTVLKKLLKTARLSTELSTSMVSDTAVIKAMPDDQNVIQMDMEYENNAKEIEAEARQDAFEKIKNANKTEVVEPEKVEEDIVEDPDNPFTNGRFDEKHLMDVKLGDQ
jgi:recombination protein RecT